MAWRAVFATLADCVEKVLPRRGWQTRRDTVNLKFMALNYFFEATDKSH